tara:strand:- start:8 stop:208 length:201 start_codon:yes stop_codon:yes gene_type:complete
MDNINKQDKTYTISGVSSRFYKIVDKDGIEMPDHYSGRRRNYEEAKKMVDSLNKNGEYRPYKMIEV